MNPQENIEGGVKYVKSLLDRFNGNIILALAAYNAGPNAVKKYDGVPPYKETQNYVKSILSNYL
jgi:soluble lytic murein transglycosylase-like protein